MPRAASPSAASETTSPTGSTSAPSTASAPSAQPGSQTAPSAALANSLSGEPSAAPEPEPVVAAPTPDHGRPTAFYIAEFVAGVSFTTAQVTLVWAIIDHDETAQRNRLLLITAGAAAGALIAVSIAGLSLSTDNARHKTSSATATKARTEAYVGLGAIGIRGTF